MAMDIATSQERIMRDFAESMWISESRDLRLQLSVCRFDWENPCKFFRGGANIAKNLFSRATIFAELMCIRIRRGYLAFRVPLPTHP